MSALALCVHGHFYQPPRENPFNGMIPVEAGAAPFRNFNEKIHNECYQPNVELGNFDLISFNLGPTLARWIERAFPDTHARIVTSDRHHQQTYGRGNGLAQAYNHTILPLAAHRDKVTQIKWGIADFHHRFGHHPEGMWLPEMAVDMDTLVAMESLGLRYTILSAGQVRSPNNDHGDGRGDVRITGTGPYAIELPNGHHFTIFVRDETLSNRLAFDPHLTQNASWFAQWCRSAIKADRGLFLIATDGETFGHHQPLRQFFLQALLRAEARKAGFEITTLGDHLHRHPSAQRVILRENTAWSCAHGVARWSRGCACTTGDSSWKPRLRAAFDRLAGSVDALYQSECARWDIDPWEMRDGYINVILGRVGGAELLQQFSSSPVTNGNAIRLLRLLEAERYCQAMYTSCGFFFDDLDRIEVHNNIGAAAKGIEQVRLATGIDLSDSVGYDLAAARSGISGRTGKDAYDVMVA